MPWPFHGTASTAPVVELRPAPRPFSLARRFSVPLLAYAASRAWFVSWDRFVIPWPFARVHFAIGEPYFPKKKMTDEEALVVKDSNGTQLHDGDSVTLIKDLKVKGTSVTLKRGTLVKNIRLTDDEGEIECNAEKVKGLVLKTEFVKKA